jgi:hypothetical protein
MELESSPDAFTHRSVNQDKAYNFDLAIWGKGQVTAFEKVDQGETPDLDTISPTFLYNTFEGIMPKKKDKILTQNKTGTIHQLAQRLQNPQGRLSGDDKATLKRLRHRDQQVRAHERAHHSAAGGAAMGGPKYTYQRGPDRRLYAIGGQVMISTTPAYGDPRAVIRKMQQVRAAALAPANPSAADVRVAASATNAESAARAQLAQMLIDKRLQLHEDLSADRREIANEYAKEQNTISNSNKAATVETESNAGPSERPRPTQNLERQRAKRVAATYQQARLESAPDVTESIIN